MIVNIEERHIEELAGLYEELSGKKSDLAKLREKYRVLKQNSSYILAGEEIDGKLVGTIMGIECFDLSEDCKPFMLIDNIVVSKNARGKGIGKCLMRFCENEASERGCSFIILVSAGHRKEAHRFYEKLGYSETGAVGFKKYI